MPMTNNLLLPMLATLSVATGSSQTGGSVPAPPPAAESDRAIVAAAFDRWSKGGTRFFEELLAPDVIWTIKGSGPSAGTIRGREAFLARAVRPFGARLSKPVKPTVRRIWAEGDTVAVQWDGEGQARDGRAYRNSYVWIFRMRAGRVQEADAYLDLPAYDDVLKRIPLPRTP